MNKREPITEEQIREMFRSNAFGCDFSSKNKNQSGTVEVTYRVGPFHLEIVDIKKKDSIADITKERNDV